MESEWNVILRWQGCESRLPRPRCVDCGDWFRDAALETYIRRVYRAFEILDIKVNAGAEQMTVDWAFRFRDVSPDLTPVREVVVLESLQGFNFLCLVR